MSKIRSRMPWVVLNRAPNAWKYVGSYFSEAEAARAAGSAVGAWKWWGHRGNAQMMLGGKGDDEIQVAATDIVLQECDGHDGRGWYYWLADCPDEGTVGAFKSANDALTHAFMEHDDEPVWVDQKPTVGDVWACLCGVRGRAEASRPCCLGGLASR